MEQLKGRTALITGAGKGIGRALALALAKEGVNLDFVSRTETDLKEVADLAVETDKDIKVATAVVDVKDIDSVNRAYRSVTAELGDVDILVNNAGVAKFGKFLDLEVAWLSQSQRDHRKSSKVLYLPTNSSNTKIPFNVNYLMTFKCQ